MSKPRIYEDGQVIRLKALDKARKLHEEGLPRAVITHIINAGGVVEYGPLMDSVGTNISGAIKNLEDKGWISVDKQ